MARGVLRHTRSSEHTTTRVTRTTLSQDDTHTVRRKQTLKTDLTSGDIERTSGITKQEKDAFYVYNVHIKIFVRENFYWHKSYSY